MSEKVVKLIVLGDASVGKTATIIRYVDNEFLENTISNIGIDFKWKIIKWHGEEVKVQVWDTAGQEKFRSISVQFIRRAQGIVLFYSVDNKDSYNHLQDWLLSIKEHNGGSKHDDGPPIIIIGNKTDLDWVVSKEDAQQFAKNHGLEIFFTSAKTGENINEAFRTISNLVLLKQPNQKEEKKTVFVEQPEPQKPSGGCC